ncbi:MAG: LuxR C-terminal-related transcriptional regulator [Myxococcota bacterium]
MSPARVDGIRAVNAIDVVEMAYRLDGNESEWLSALLARARPDIDSGGGVYAFTGNENVPNLEASPVFVQHELDPGFGQCLLELNRDAPRDIYDLLRTRLVTCGGLVEELGESSPVVQHFQGVLRPSGFCDGFSMFAHDAEGGSVSISAPSRHVIHAAPRVRGIWRRVGLHVASALRLRRKLASQPAVRDALLDPSGQLHDVEDSIKDDARARRALVSAVRAMERARSSKMRASAGEALDLWRGLVAGEWSLIEHWESGGRRYLAAYRNRPEVRDPRALTPTERSMLRYLGLGATNKDIVYALGLPLSTVSTSVTRILKKLRLRSRVDVALLGDPSRMDRLNLEVDGEHIDVLAVDARLDAAATATLSRTETEVAASVARGLSNQQIATERQVSPRTVANQLRSIYEKLGVKNRGELAHTLTRR